MARSSRYRNAGAFRAADGGQLPFPGFRAREIGAATAIIEHEIKQGDRLDLLALHYYNDSRLWWRIVDANPEFLYGGHAVRRDHHPRGEDFEPPLEEDDPLFLELVIHPSMVGQTIRIPRAVE